MKTSVLYALLSLSLGAALSEPAFADSTRPYPDIADSSHASPAVAAWVARFFDAKSRHDPIGLTDNFSKEHILYIDTTLGWQWKSYQELKDLFVTYMPKWPASGLSYPTLVLGDEKSALVAFTDTPELFGGELRILGAVDFENGKVVRWMDYWDGRPYGIPALQKARTPADKWPNEFGAAEVGEHASAKLRTTSETLNTMLAAGDGSGAAKLFSFDAVYIDMSTHAYLAGQAAIGRYLERAVGKLPYGRNAKLQHVVGSDTGGGYEWVTGTGAPVRYGATALVLDPDGKILKLMTVWDSSQLTNTQMHDLAALAIDP